MRLAAPLILGVAALLAPSCAPPAARTPFLRTVDLVEMTDRMAGSLAHDDRLVARGAADAPWVISLERIVNHTNQIIPDREKWLYVARLRARLAESALSRERSLVWVIPPERWPAIADELDVAEPAELRLAPTHVLTGSFSALTVTSGAGRSDAYLCTYQLFELATGAIVWEDAWEVKRDVRGRTYD